MENLDSNITFYSSNFKLNSKEKETFINISTKIINILSDSEIINLDDPLIQESIFKSSIFCIQANEGIFTKLSKEEQENIIKKYAFTTKSDIQKNFKDIHRISTIFSNIKDFINKLSNSDKEITKVPLKILRSLAEAKNFKRKLDEMHNSFFDITELSFLFKKLIWNVFICLVNENELKSSTFDKTKFFFTICQDILIRIPNKFYPRKLGDKMTNIDFKKNIIKEYFKKYMSDDIDNEEVSQNIKNLYSKIDIFKKEINLEGEDLSDKNKIEDIIKKVDIYYSQNTLNKLNFDERIIIIIEADIINNSPKINKIGNENFKNNKDLLITCNRELFKEEKESEKIKKYNFNIEENSPLKKNQKNLSNEKEAVLMMTTYTRVWNLLYWVKGALKNYEIKNKYISNLQKKFKPKYLNEIEYKKFIPINTYAKIYMDELIKLLTKYKVNSKFAIDLIQLYIYCISLLIENDLNIFSENFASLLLYNDDFIKASVALCFELALTIIDITEIELNSIYDQLKLDVYDFWKIILPSNNKLYHVELQKHLEEIDYQLSTFLIWRNPSNKFDNELKEFLENENVINDEKEKNGMYKLILHESSLQSSFSFHKNEDFKIPFINENFKTNATNKLIFKDCDEYVENYNKLIGISILLHRLIIYCIALNRLIFENFSTENNDSKISVSSPIFIDDYIKKECELIIKVILTNYDDIKIMWGLHIDQFVLCCIILVLEKYKLFIFSNIKNENLNNDSNNNSILKINKNILHNSYNKSKLSINEDSHIFNHVKISNQHFLNLYDFYNEKFKTKFIKYYNNIKNIKRKTKIDYFNVQKDLNDLLKLQISLNIITNSNNEENEDENNDEFEYLEKSKKRLKINEKRYILFTEENNKINNNDNNINKNQDKISFDNKNDNNSIEESISLLKKLNNKNNNQLYFDLFKEEKYSAYRNDNLKQIYNNIIKSELPPNEENRKANKNKLKELIKNKNH